MSSNLPDTDFENFDEAWAKVKALVDKGMRIIEDFRESDEKMEKSEYSQGYTIIYNLCVQREASANHERLYRLHNEAIEEFLKEKVLPKLANKRDEFILIELESRWERFRIFARWMYIYFMYVDRYYTKHSGQAVLKDKNTKEYTVAYGIFYRVVFEQHCETIVNIILSMINSERDGQSINRFLIKSIISIFGSMKVKPSIYNDEFERPFLAKSREYYQANANEWINTDGLPAYLIKAEEAILTEQERVDSYLLGSTKEHLVRALYSELLEKHETVLLDKPGSGCRNLLQENKKEDLSRLFRLYHAVENGLKPIASILKEHITEMGKALVQKRESAQEESNNSESKAEKTDPMDASFVYSMLDLQETCQSLVNTEFQGHQLFQKALKEAFESFMNHEFGKVTCAELLSTFCDRILKSGGVKHTESEIESLLERLVQLFGYLSEKDMFGEIYRNQLSKRLLGNRCASNDAERSMIAKLKLRCGAQFTAKMEGMMKDLMMGDAMKKNFKEYCNRTHGSVIVGVEGALIDGIDFSVEVLTTGHWPTHKMVDLALPAPMARCVDLYHEFYAHQTQHRCLKWVNSLGSATVKANFNRTYDVMVTTLQAVALLSFNQVDDWLTLREITQRLNIEEEVCKRVLHSFACGKYKILVKDPPSKGLNPSDKFKVNDKFVSPTRKFRIPMSSLDESHNPKRVEEDRSIAIEAAIVRIMKTRKHMGHQQLVSEVLAQLHFFKPNPRLVKRRIEHLIDREYLERDTEQTNFYKYLA